jgi:hypothetical protein
MEMLQSGVFRFGKIHQRQALLADNNGPAAV